MANLLASEKNSFQGRSIIGQLPDNTEKFKQDLSYSIDEWRNEGTLVVWLTLSDAQSNFVPIAIELGFSFHHVQKTCLILVKQLQADTFVPEFVNHGIGVGGIVFNADNEVLSIVEKHHMAISPEHWKFPGGTLDNGEMISDTAVREVFEETGIQSKFQGVLGFRHYHRGQFGTSNMYYLCRLEALTTEINPCPQEIGKAKWFHIQDYLACPGASDFNKEFLRLAIQQHGLTSQDIGDLHGCPSEEYEIFTI